MTACISFLLCDALEALACLAYLLQTESYCLLGTLEGILAVLICHAAQLTSLNLGIALYFLGLAACRYDNLGLETIWRASSSA